MKKIQFSKISKCIIGALSVQALSLGLVANHANAALYRVTESTGIDIVQYSYGQKRNAAGDAILSGRVTYNFPIQWDYLSEADFDAIENLAERQHELYYDLDPIEDRKALELGNPTANDLSWAKNYLVSQSSSVFYQKVGEVIVMATLQGETEDIPIFDTEFDGTDQVTRSTISYANGITEDGILFGTGSAPYLPVTVYDEEDNDREYHYWVREFTNKGFVYVNGQLKPIEAEENTYGGRSSVYDMRGTIAVGSSSLSLNPDAVEFIERETENGCRDPENVAPFEACLQSVEANLYNENAYMWILDRFGNVVDGQDLGFLVTPHENDDRAYQGVAAAVNANGVAVGYSHAWSDPTVRDDPSENESRGIYAAVYKETGNVDFTDKREWFASRALDINDSGIAIGYMEKFINGVARTKFFWADTNADEIDAVFPDDFFAGSSSVAHSINNNGMIVGEGEFETHNDSSSDPRRRHGFLYDSPNEIFYDINDLLECDSLYEVIEARHINDENDIFGTAIVKQPKRDSKGEIVLDRSGNIEQVDTLVAVVIERTDGEIEDCTRNEDKVERQGASMNYLLALLGFFGLGRRFKR